LNDKRWHFEESIRIPFIVCYPGMIPDPGRRAEQMVLNIDLAPTVLDMAGVTAPENMDGKSILPEMKNKNTRGRDAWLYEYFRDYSYNVPEHAAVRTDRHKYVEFVGRRKPELYDLVDDPKEMKNLYGAPPGAAVLPDALRHSIRNGSLGIFCPLYDVLLIMVCRKPDAAFFPDRCCRCRLWVLSFIPRLDLISDFLFQRRGLA